MKGVVVVGLFIILFLLSIAIIKVGWGWIVPDIFAGAVEAGIMVSDLTWSQINTRAGGNRYSLYEK